MGYMGALSVPILLKNTHLALPKVSVLSQKEHRAKFVAFNSLYVGLSGLQNNWETIAEGNDVRASVISLVHREKSCLSRLQHYVSARRRRHKNAM